MLSQRQPLLPAVLGWASLAVTSSLLTGFLMAISVSSVRMLRWGVPELVCNYFRNPAATIVTAHVNNVIIEYDL